MISCPSHFRSSISRGARLFLLLICPLLLLTTSGCSKHASHTSDSQLRKIDGLLDTQLPAGTPRARVGNFLSSRGYPLEPARDSRTIVAIVRQVDTETLQPATARGTFHFDERDKLLSYNLIPAPDVPVKP